MDKLESYENLRKGRPLWRDFSIFKATPLILRISTSRAYMERREKKRIPLRSFTGRNCLELDKNDGTIKQRVIIGLGTCSTHPSIVQAMSR